MKTFETEKHNIPEGATHYCNESDDTHFCWFSGVDTDMFEVMTIGGSWSEAHQELYVDDGITLIPQTKEVEWVDGLPPVGVECVFTPHNMQWGFNHIEDFTGTVLYYEGEQFVFMLNHTKYKLEGDMVVVSRTDKGDFAKPETEADKLEREELEAAYYLYQMNNRIKLFSTVSFEEFKNKLPKRLEAWLAIVKETGYRKGE